MMLRNYDLDGNYFIESCILLKGISACLLIVHTILDWFL